MATRQTRLMSYANTYRSGRHAISENDLGDFLHTVLNGITLIVGWLLKPGVLKFFAVCASFLRSIFLKF